MRLVIFIPLLVLALCCASTKDDTKTSGTLDGTWVPIRQEIGGESLPAAACESQRLIIGDSFPEAFETKTSRSLFLSVFKKQ